MQILIEILGKARQCSFTNKRDSQIWAELQLSKLLFALKEDGYRINTLFGLFIYDHSKNRIIDVGKPGPEVELNYDFVSKIIHSNAKMAVIFTEEKYIVFSDRYFLAIQFCHMRKVLPLPLYTVVENYESLVTNEDNEILDTLYFDQFEFIYGKGEKAKPYIQGSNEEITSGYEIPGPIASNPKEMN